MYVAAVQLALNDISPTPETLGTLNAVALTLMSGLRAFAPVAFSSLFAFEANAQVMNGYLVWFILLTMTAVNAIALKWLPKNAEGRIKSRSDETE
jgi:hypothetical protein